MREFYLERRRAELPVFLKVLKALPKDQLAYRPHDRSPSAGEVVWTLMNELQACIEVVRTNKTEVRQPSPGPLDEMIATFEQRFNELIDLVARMDDEAWDRKAQFYFQGKMVREMPVGVFLWFILFDSIHHRGQLAAYLRPMGGKVPAIYGPSADERPDQR